MVLAECSFALSRGSITFLLLMSTRFFLRRFLCTHCSCWEYKSALSVWLLFKNLKWIILRWSHHTHSITFLLWSSTFGVAVEIHHCQSTAFCIEHCHKRPMIFLRNRLFFYLEKKTFCYGYVIFLILFTKSMRKPNAQLAHFYYLFFK